MHWRNPHSRCKEYVSGSSNNDDDAVYAMHVLNIGQARGKIEDIMSLSIHKKKL
jgi:hypothetical protein